MNRLFAVRKLRMVVCTGKLKMLRCSNYILLAQEVGAKSLRIKSLANGYDENVFGMFLIYKSLALLENWCQSCVN